MPTSKDLELHGQNGIETIAPGFITAPPMAKMAEKYKDKPEILSQIKLPTYEYVEHFLEAPFCLISELPSIIDDHLQDNQVSQMSLVDLKKRELGNKKQRLSQLQTAVEELKAIGITSENPWYKNAAFASKFGLSAIQGEEKLLSKFDNIFAKKSDIHDSEASDIESELKLHQLYIKSLEHNAEHQNLFDFHLAAFDKKYEELEKILQYRILPFENQVRIQVAMILSGMEL